MANPFIPFPFARNGTKTQISDQRDDGVVDFNQGYGTDYSRTLGVEPNAKAVERDGQNWLYGLITENLIEWQLGAFPTYLAQRQYAVGAVVRYTTGGPLDVKLWRCIVAPPSAGVVPTDLNYWELVPTDAEAVARICFVNRGEIPDNTDWSSITRGLWSVSTTSPITTGTNAPNTNKLGYLISYTFGTGSVVQTYYAQDGTMMTRSAASGIWSQWATFAVRATTLAGYGILDAMRAGGVFAAASNYNMNTVTESGCVALTTVPATWADLGWPLGTTGALLTFGGTIPTDTRLCQMFYTNTNRLFTRFGSRTGTATVTTWTAWVESITSAQQVIDTLLPRNNTWTGTNLYQNTTTFNGHININATMRWFGLNINAQHNVDFSPTDVGFVMTNGPNAGALRRWDILISADANRGMYDRTNNRWDLIFSNDNLAARFHARSMTLNLNQAANYSELIFQNGQAASVVSHVFFDGGFNIGFRTRNANNNGQTAAYLSTNGDWIVANGAVRAAARVYAGSAFLQEDGNIGGSVWGSETAAAYTRNPFRYILNAQGTNAISLYWENNRLQGWVDGGWRGTVAFVADLAQFWPRNEFLRPDQGGWQSQGSQSGQFFIPSGGVWAWWVIWNLGGSNLTGNAYGISGGGSVINPAGRDSTCLMWRIY